MITRETQAAFLERPKEERRKKHFFQTWTTQCLSLRLLQEQNRGADTERTSRGRGVLTHFQRFVIVPSRSVSGRLFWEQLGKEGKAGLYSDLLRLKGHSSDKALAVYPRLFFSWRRDDGGPVILLAETKQDPWSTPGSCVTLGKLLNLSEHVAPFAEWRQLDACSE